MGQRCCQGTFDPRGRIMDASLLLAIKVAASACIGLLIGLERQWAHKEAGVRSFAIVTLLGTLTWLVEPALALVQFAAVLLLILLVNVYACPVSGILDRERRERRHSGKQEEIDEPEKAVYAGVQGQSGAGKLPTGYHD